MTRDRGGVDVLVGAAELNARVAALARRIGADYGGTPDPVVAVGILKGSAIFLADLVRAVGTDVEVDFMSISSYARGGSGSGIVRILKDLEADIGGRDVLIVEDIVDTGLTLSYLRKTLLGRRPRSLRTVALLDKSARRIVPVPVEYRGFEIPDVFVVGYGLDWDGRGRNIGHILAVREAGPGPDPRALAGFLDAGL